MEARATPAPARLTIAARSGAISVRAVNGAEVEVRGATLRHEPDGSGRIQGGSGSIEVVCPEGTDVILGTSSGRVTMTGPLGDVRITSSSGTVNVEQARSLDVRVRSGGVEIGRCVGACHVVAVSGRTEIGTAGSLDITSVSGTIVAEAVGGAKVRTTSGTVTVELDRAADVDVRAVSSTVKISVPPGVAPDLKIRTLSGSVRTDVDAGRDCVISVHTVSGSIRVRWK